MLLYIECYDKYEGELVGDFMRRDDYVEFCKQIDNEHMQRDVRTMLFVENLRFSSGHIPVSGKIYDFPDEMLNLNWIPESPYVNFADEMSSDSSSIFSFKVFSNYDGESFFDEPVVERYDYHNYVKGSWDGPPCGLARLSDEIKVIVKEVGQGNWNEVYVNDRCELIYDLGASIHSTIREIRSLVNFSTAFSHKPSLIISHWDIDHYQALLEVNELVIGDLCCIFVPDKLTSLTSQRAYQRLIDNNTYVVAISPSRNRKLSRRISLEVINKGRNYIFMKGEESTDKNKSGLVVAIWNSKSSIILAADHHYYQLVNDIIPHLPSNNILHLITPHHGGHAGSVSKLGSLVVNPGKCITSTGKNSYGHPKDKNRQELVKIGFEWKRTDYEKADIEVCL